MFGNSKLDWFEFIIILASELKEFISKISQWKRFCALIHQNSYLTEKMKIFKLLEQQADHIGLRRPDSFDESIHFNLNNSAFMSGLWATIVLVGIPFFKASTASDFARSYFAFSSTFAVIYMFCTFILKTHPLHKMIQHSEEIIQKRKFRKINENIAFIKFKWNKMHSFYL